MVFYSLAETTGYKEALNPIPQWVDIWIKHGQGQTSATFLKNYFLPKL